MENPELVRYAKEELEGLRGVLLLKEQLTSDAFTALVNAVDNEDARTTFRELVDEARHARADTESVLSEWSRRATDPSRLPITNVSYRDIVNEWAGLHESSASRLRHLSTLAPTDDLRRRLETLAEKDARAAERLRALL